MATLKFGRVSFEREYPPRRVADHEVFMSFFDDEGAVAFQEWWEDKGSAQFMKWKMTRDAKAQSEVRP